ncbi:uncharacterized protein LOC112181654 [Rosa chinensis]|uniref:uncharacterized protein LOC112181654 n=1 Tax=Rosa chinensis TaxID=74649 RepID=UPI000D0972BD|nr:uncharacterized protein LOC112181654 [Rosa chinensis]
MDKMECNKVQPVMRKVKKKQVKDELDRQKQAEKKKRRLEKALATSAAIISELEKKKQKKKEEQQRLDEEGAAIAEAVALHVLLDEDSDDRCEIVMNKDEVLKSWDCPGDFDLFMGGGRACYPYQDSAKCSLEGMGWGSNGYRSGCKWGGLGNNEWAFSTRPYGRDYRHPSFCQEAGWGPTGFAAGLIAAQAVSSLQIAEDSHEGTIVLDGMLRR